MYEIRPNLREMTDPDNYTIERRGKDRYEIIDRDVGVVIASGTMKEITDRYTELVGVKC